MNPINEYLQIIDNIYGTYFDSLKGFSINKEEMESQQQNFIKELSVKNPDIAKMEYLDNCKMIYGKGDPNNSKSYPLHISTQKEFKARNSEKGLNYEFAGNMVVITIFHYWEDKYRADISKYLDKKDNIKLSVFGDLRILRQSIVHHQGKALKEINKCEVFKWFSENDKLFFTRDMIEDIIREVKDCLNTLLEKDGNQFSKTIP